jgi:type IV pilus assembly protein PilB
MTIKTEIAELLIREGLLEQKDIVKAYGEVQKTGLSLEKALVKLGVIAEEDIVRVKASAFGLPYVDLSDYVVDAEVVKLIPESLARKHRAVPLFKIGQRITVGMVDPQDVFALDQIRRVAKVDMVEPVLVTEKGISRVLETCYSTQAGVSNIVEQISQEANEKSIGQTAGDMAEDAPIIRLLNVLILQSVRDRVSDIHIEPEDDMVRVRSRIDGILHEIAILPKKLQNSLTSRVKILAELDISENRKPQDGRIRMSVEKKDLDIRVSTFPTVHGENIVMRLMDKSAVLFGLKEIGFFEQELVVLNKMIHRPNGIVLVTGPTGSGKTSTLYAALTTISSMEKNIITIEDPVEYDLPIIRQTQINVKAGITFADGLRSILRQDPDVIMVGEIRDRETADVAIQSSLTGHLVFSTLHTNDAPTALTRLLDMGIEPFLISSSVVGVLAQRLVRVICEKCKEVHEFSAEVLQALELTAGQKLYRGKGCERCRQTGFNGRTGIFEILTVDEDVRRMIDARMSSDEIRKKAINQGMRTLRQAGLEKILAGVTTPEEVLRVTESES